MNLVVWNSQWNTKVLRAGSAGPPTVLSGPPAAGRYRTLYSLTFPSAGSQRTFRVDMVGFRTWRFLTPPRGSEEKQVRQTQGPHKHSTKMDGLSRSGTKAHFTVMAEGHYFMCSLTASCAAGVIGAPHYLYCGNSRFLPLGLAL